MLEGRHIVVTGAAGNLGSAVCVRLLKGGANVFAIVHNKDEETPLASALFGAADIADDRLVVYTAELGHEAAVDTAYAEATEWFGPLWGSAHCAGGFAGGELKDTSLDAFERMVDVNLRSTFLCCRSAVRRLVPGGRIVNVAAYNPAMLHGVRGSSVYAACKAGVIAMTRAIAEEGFYANCVAPATMRTPQNARAMPNADHEKWVPLEDVAESIAFLLSPEAGATSGAIVTLPPRR